MNADQTAPRGASEQSDLGSYLLQYRQLNREQTTKFVFPVNLVLVRTLE